MIEPNTPANATPRGSSEAVDQSLRLLERTVPVAIDPSEAARAERLVLWDIDGTLVDTFGAGRMGMDRAGQRVIDPGFSLVDVDLGGNLDPLILAAACGRLSKMLGTTIDPANHEAEFRAAYGVELNAIFASNHRCHACPSVLETLQSQRGQPEAMMTLLTGNYAVSAAIKLAWCGIDPSWFAAGFWGDDAPTRPELVKHAMSRFNEVRRGTTSLSSKALAPQDVWIIGDTLRDIDAARANGCTAIGVTTGRADRETLREAGAHQVVDDVSEIDWS